MFVQSKSSGGFGHEERGMPAGTPMFDAPVEADFGELGPVNAFPMLSYVDGADSGPPAPWSLDPNAPRRVPGMGGPKVGGDDAAKASIYKRDAEKLLTGKDMDERGDRAKAALEMLNRLDPVQRGKVIDGLDDQAFDNLLKRVPPDERAAMQLLVETSKNPARKLRMWKETHLSKSRNAVNARKGDTGVDDLQTEYERTNLYSTMSWDKQVKADRKWEKKHRKELDQTDEDGEPLPDKKRTVQQQKNLARHKLDVKRAAHTKEEIDHEVAMLLPGGKADGLTLDQVNELIERKERESAIEAKHDIDLTTSVIHGEKAKDTKTWSVKDLETIDRTIDNLPKGHFDGEAQLREIHRSSSEDVNGRWFGDGRMEILEPVFHSADVDRKKVGHRYVGTDASKVSRLELTLTHELGHAFASNHPEAFEKFKTAAGWERVAKDALTRDGITQSQLDYLERERPNPTRDSAHRLGKRRSYSPNNDSETTEKQPYWAVDQTAFPAGEEWNYAHVNPSEHFAESYEMAVHDPATFYKQHVTAPMNAAKSARDAVSAIDKQIKALPDVPANAQKLRDLRATLAKNTANAEQADRAVRQLGGQFEVMREDVFGANKATAAAANRLRQRGVHKDEVTKFEQRAAELMTPAQVSTLEAQFR